MCKTVILAQQQLAHFQLQGLLLNLAPWRAQQPQVSMPTSLHQLTRARLPGYLAQ